MDFPVLQYTFLHSIYWVVAGAINLWHLHNIKMTLWYSRISTLEYPDFVKYCAFLQLCNLLKLDLLYEEIDLIP